MKVDLPLETWTDIFGFLRRSQLVQLSPHIRDRQFSSSLQFFLHKCGQIRLGDLCIESSTNGDEQTAIVNWKFPLPDVPIPKNVTDFQDIELRYFDQAVLGFMEELNRNSLLTNVNLYFDNDSCLMLMRAFLTNILPLLTSINLTNVYFNPILENTPLLTDVLSGLAKPLFQSTRILDICDDWYLDWLYTPREDGKPRVLFLNYSMRASISSFVERVKKDFLSAKEAISFFIHLYYFDDAHIKCAQLENLAKEKLAIKVIDENVHGEEVVISRYAIGTTDEWIKKMNPQTKSKRDYMLNYQYRNIIIK